MSSIRFTNHTDSPWYFSVSPTITVDVAQPALNLLQAPHQRANNNDEANEGDDYHVTHPVTYELWHSSPSAVQPSFEFVSPTGSYAIVLNGATTVIERGRTYEIDERQRLVASDKAPFIDGNIIQLIHHGNAHIRLTFLYASRVFGHAFVAFSRVNNTLHLHINKAAVRITPLKPKPFTKHDDNHFFDLDTCEHVHVHWNGDDMIWSEEHKPLPAAQAASTNNNIAPSLTKYHDDNSNKTIVQIKRSRLLLSCDPTLPSSQACMLALLLKQLPFYIVPFRLAQRAISFPNRARIDLLQQPEQDISHEQTTQASSISHPQPIISFACKHLTGEPLFDRRRATPNPRDDWSLQHYAASSATLDSAIEDAVYGPGTQQQAQLHTILSALDQHANNSTYMSGSQPSYSDALWLPHLAALARVTELKHLAAYPSLQRYLHNMLSSRNTNTAEWAAQWQRIQTWTAWYQQHDQLPTQTYQQQAFPYQVPT